MMPGRRGAAGGVSGRRGGGSEPPLAVGSLAARRGAEQGIRPARSKHPIAGQAASLGQWRMARMRTIAQGPGAVRIAAEDMHGLASVEVMQHRSGAYLARYRIAPGSLIVKPGRLAVGTEDAEARAKGVVRLGKERWAPDRGARTDRLLALLALHLLRMIAARRHAANRA